MNRRNAVKTIALATGSLISLPFWMTACSSDGHSTHLSTFSVAEQETLAAVADTIIPQGNSIGALSVGFSASEQKSAKDFFNLIKSETINGFTTSKEVMLNYYHYKVAPGHYYGCVDVKA